MTSKYLMLRTVDEKDQAYGGFQWPTEIGSVVTAPDWDSNPVCGGGLHGLLWGEGDILLLSDSASVVWQVIASDTAPIDLGGKCKVKTCTLVYRGDRDGAISYLLAHGAFGRAVPWATVTTGKYGAATAGYKGVATAGDYGTATVGDYGTATTGVGGQAIAGYGGAAIAGYEGVATACYSGTATTGTRGMSTAGRYGTATAGHEGVATAGHEGVATAGDYGTATAGVGGKAAAGEGGEIRVHWYDGRRYRTVIGYIGENGLLPNVKYRVENGRFFRV